MSIYLISGINYENSKRLHDPFVIVYFINRCNLFVMKLKDMTIKEVQDFYLDYVNNYLTTQRIADDYGITVELATQIIELGKFVHNYLAESKI